MAHASSTRHVQRAHRGPSRVLHGQTRASVIRSSASPGCIRRLLDAALGAPDPRALKDQIRAGRWEGRGADDPFTGRTAGPAMALSWKYTVSVRGET